MARTTIQDALSEETLQDVPAGGGSSLSKVPIGAIVDKSVEVIEKTIELQKASAAAAKEKRGFESSIMSLAGTPEQGLADIKFLNNEVDELGLSLKSARQNYVQFTAAVKNSNIEGGKANEIFRQISEAALLAGLSEEQTAGAFKAVGDMVRAGKLDVKDLIELDKNFMGSISMLAQSLDKSATEWEAVIKKHKLNSGESLETFGKSLDAKNHGLLYQVNNNAEASLNRAENEKQRWLAINGEVNGGLVNGAISGTASGSKAVRTMLNQDERLDKVFDGAGLDKFSFLEKFNSKYRSALGASPNDVMKVQSYDRVLYEENVEESYKGLPQAIAAKKNLQSYQGALLKEYNRKEISPEIFLRKMAIVNADLREVEGNIGSGNKIAVQKANPKKPLYGSAASTFDNEGVGSPVNIGTPRSQAKVINIGKLADITIRTTNIVEGAAQIREILTKELMEVLTDASQASQ